MMEANSGGVLRRPESALSQSHSLCTLYSPNYKMFSRPCVFFLISALNLEEASTLSLHVRFRVGSDRP